jgi:enoyl-CoA hydratase
VSEVLLDIDAGVAILTLAAPERRNAFTAEMVAELLAACEAVDSDDSVGALVLRAQGESFCAGAHRDLLARAATDPTEAKRFTQLGLAYQAFVRVGSLQVPTIAAVRGHAVGAGVNLMLATDLRIVAESARIITGFARIGIHPGGGHFVLLSRVSGREAAAAMGVFGQEISGRRAFELGLAWEALPADEVEPRAQEIAATVAADPELARATVRSFRLETGPPAASWPLGLEAERAAQMWSLRRSKLRPE